MYFRKALFKLTFATLLLFPLSASAFIGGENWDHEAAKAGVEPSYTLPILSIFTENGKVIDQKETYINSELQLKTIHLHNNQGGGVKQTEFKWRSQSNAVATLHGIILKKRHTS